MFVHSEPEKDTGNMRLIHANVFEHIDKEYKRRKRVDILLNVSNSTISTKSVISI
jgi:hypothetical protein